MNPKSAADSYQRASVENAPPLQVVRMLYQGALRFLAQAQQLDPAQQLDEFQGLLSKSDAIVSELRSSLDHDINPEIAERLDSLYDFCEAQLARATLNNDRDEIEPAAKVLQTLLEGWMKIELQTGATPAAEGDAR